MSPAAPQQLQHTILSVVSFVAFLTNFLVAFAPLPQAISVHQVPRPQCPKPSHLAHRDSFQRKSTGKLRMSVYHLTCVNFLYATLYAVEIKNTSVLVSSLVNWLITLAFTVQLLLHLDPPQRARGWLILVFCCALPVASARACQWAARECADVIGAAPACWFPPAPHRCGAGTLNNVFNVVSFGAPLIALKTVAFLPFPRPLSLFPHACIQVWRTWDTSSMPMSVSLMNLVNSTSWWLCVLSFPSCVLHALTHQPVQFWAHAG
jgi:hypothetical protein